MKYFIYYYLNFTIERFEYYYFLSAIQSFSKKFTAKIATLFHKKAQELISYSILRNIVNKHVNYWLHNKRKLCNLNFKFNVNIDREFLIEAQGS